MEINSNTNLYCLIGNPIEGSLSPLIHNTIFKSLNENSIYLAFNVSDKKLNTTLEGFKSIGVQGFNVTVPHKQTIMKYLDDLSEEAKILGAVNTVKNINGKLIGYNTDGEGFLQIFEDNNIDLTNKNILLLGAGGAAYGIGASLAMKNINSIVIANRSIDNAKDLEKKIQLINKDIITKTVGIGNNNYDKKAIDIIINSTSVGMYPMENLSPLELSGFSDDIIVYDIIYKPRETKLIKEAKARGYRTFNGISMLLNQGILSQNIWLDKSKNINLQIIEKLEGILKNL